MSKETQETPSRGYTPEIGERICDEMVEGKSLRAIAEMDGMPCKRTILNWLRTIPEFEKLYRFAQQARVEGWVAEIMDIANNGSNDWMESNDPDNPGYRFNGEHVQRSRLRIDTIKWVACKMVPRLYGDRVTAELTGANGGPIQTADVSESELARRIAFVLASGLKPHEKTH